VLLSQHLIALLTSSRLLLLCLMQLWATTKHVSAAVAVVYQQHPQHWDIDIRQSCHTVLIQQACLFQHELLLLLPTR
jgi:hypothetical protein